MKNNLFGIFAALCIVAALSSCKSQKYYIAQYDVGLTSVESPVDARQQFGRKKIVSFEDTVTSRYDYQDDIISISWEVTDSKFIFDLANMSNRTIKIDWDGCSYVNINGMAGRVMHAGIKYADMNEAQPISSIPEGSFISDLLLPTANVTLYMDGLRNTSSLIPSIYKTPEDFNAANGAASMIGKTMKIVMPIIIDGVPNEYTFVFRINRLLNKVDMNKIKKDKEKFHFLI